MPATKKGYGKGSWERRGGDNADKLWAEVSQTTPSARYKNREPLREDSEPLRVVLGCWEDDRGSRYEVTLDSEAEDGWPTCSVNTVRPPNGQQPPRTMRTRRLLSLDDNFNVIWRDSFYLDMGSASKTSVQWRPNHGGKSFVWSRRRELLQPDAEPDAKSRKGGKGSHRIDAEPDAHSRKGVEDRHQRTSAAALAKVSGTTEGDSQRGQSARADAFEDEEWDQGAGSRRSKRSLGKDSGQSVRAEALEDEEWDQGERSRRSKGSLAKSSGRSVRADALEDEDWDQRVGSRRSRGSLAKASGQFVRADAFEDEEWDQGAGSKRSTGSLAKGSGQSVRADALEDEEWDQGDASWLHDEDNIASCGIENFSSSGLREPASTDFAPHFCIFQGDGHGIAGWSRENGSRQNRWDAILCALLQCVDTDGFWPREILASAFVGSDVIHISGAIQRLASPFVGHRADGSERYAPATPHGWEKMMWEQRGTNNSGLRWELSRKAPQSRHDAHATLLRRIDSLLQDASDDSVAIAFDYQHFDATYEELKMEGVDRGEPRTNTVFVLLGGANGFDGMKDTDNSLQRAIVEKFERRLGKERVAIVNLIQPERRRDLRLTTSKMAAFLSTEYLRGTLGQVVAGIEGRIENGAGPGEIGPY